MGTTMKHPACEWVRGRLPLWRGPLESLGDPDGDSDGGDSDGGDLDAADERAIERHLAGCAACRAHRSGLSRAFEALGAAAAAVPAGPDGPSLWPLLERRIAAHLLAGASRPREEDVADRLGACAALDAERPLRTAWMQDTLKEGFADSILGGLGGLRSSASMSRVVGTSLAASILLLVVAIPALRPWQPSTRADIRPNARPVAMLVGPPSARPISAPEPPADVAAAAHRSRRRGHRRDLPAGQLAQADLKRSPAAPVTAPAPASTAATEPAGGTRSGTTSRIGYDLESVTPMPSDGRDSEAVY